MQPLNLVKKRKKRALPLEEESRNSKVLTTILVFFAFHVGHKCEFKINKQISHPNLVLVALINKYSLKKLSFAFHTRHKNGLEI